MTRKEKLSLIEAANKRIDGTGHRVTEVYPTKHRKYGFVGQIMASGINIEIIIKGSWGAIAVACLAWAHVRKSRRINITTKDNQSVWLEGYSAKEAEKILHSAKQISVIDTEPDEK